MAKKNRAAAKPPREMTKLHLARWQRQQRRQRIILISGVSIIAAIVLLVLVGWYLTDYRPMHRTVIKVNDTEFNMSYFIDAMKINGEGLKVEDYQGMAPGIVLQIEQSELIRQGAAALGFSVSDNVAQERLAILSANYARLVGRTVPINRATVDIVRSVVLQDILSQEYFDEQVPQTAEQAHILAMFLESEAQAAGLRDRLKGSENFTALAGEYSLEESTRTSGGDCGWHPQDILAELLGSTVPSDYAFGSQAGVLSQPLLDKDKYKPLGYWLIRVLEKEAGGSDAQIQAVLLGSEAEAREVRSKLEVGGDLVTLAKEFSQHEQSQKNGGELGVVSEGEVSTAFDEFVFSDNVTVGNWSQPVSDNTVETKGGAWLVDVLGKEADRQLDSADRDSLITKAYNEWVVGLQVDSTDTVESYLTTEDYQWAAEQVVKRLAKSRQ